MTILIDPQEKLLYLATPNGWVKKVGFACKLNGLKCSVVINKKVFGADLIVSDLSSGYRIHSFVLSLFDLLNCDTKEKTLVLIEEQLERLAEILRSNKISAAEIANRANVEIAKHMNKFGPMPPMLNFEEVGDGEA